MRVVCVAGSDAVAGGDCQALAHPSPTPKRQSRPGGRTMEGLPPNVKLCARLPGAQRAQKFEGEYINKTILLVDRSSIETCTHAFSIVSTLVQLLPYMTCGDVCCDVAQCAAPSEDWAGAHRGADSADFGLG